MDALIALAESGVREQAARECRRVAETLDGLGPAGWRTKVPTCGEWTVRELTAHLAFVAEMLGSSVRKSLAGNPGPVWADIATARSAIYGAKKALNDEQLLTDFRTHAAEISATLEKVRHDDLTTPGWHPAGMWTVARIVVQWLWEVAIHRYDLMNALGRDARMNEETLGICLDYLITASGRYLNGQADSALDATFRASTHDPARDIVFRFGGGQATATAGRAASPAEVVFHSDGQTWLLCFVNRIDRAEAVATGKLRVEGDPALADRFWKSVKTV